MNIYVQSTSVKITKCIGSPRHSLCAYDLPLHIFKYKSLSEEESLTRCLDIIENERLYFPKASQLNDPLEGTSFLVSSAVAGASFYKAAGQLEPLQQRMSDRYRILSFSSLGTSPQMWALYASNYSGVCFVFSTIKQSFQGIRPIEYTNEKKRYTEQDITQGAYEESPYEFFMRKQKDWSFEHEYRIIQKAEDSPYYNFSADELIGIILGHSDGETKENQKMLRLACEKTGRTVWKTLICAADYKVRIVPYEFEAVISDGTIEEQLEQFYESHKTVRRFSG